MDRRGSRSSGTWIPRRVLAEELPGLGERFGSSDVDVVPVDQETLHAADEARQHVEAEIEGRERRDLAPAWRPQREDSGAREIAVRTLGLLGERDDRALHVERRHAAALRIRRAEER